MTLNLVMLRAGFLVRGVTFSNCLCRGPLPVRNRVCGLQAPDHVPYAHMLPFASEQFSGGVLIVIRAVGSLEIPAETSVSASADALTDVNGPGGGRRHYAPSVVVTHLLSWSSSSKLPRT